jgi:hypothetical protein
MVKGRHRRRAGRRECECGYGCVNVAGDHDVVGDKRSHGAASHTLSPRHRVVQQRHRLGQLGAPVRRPHPSAIRSRRKGAHAHAPARAVVDHVAQAVEHQHVRPRGAQRQPAQQLL